MIIIIGAGIAGLSLAWHLIKEGKEVCLIEQDEIGKGASWAATAYLEPRPGVGKMRQLEWQSVNLWPSFADEISQTSQMPIDYRCGSQLKVAFEDTLTRFEKEQTLREQGAEAFKGTYNVDYEVLSPEQAHELEPHLSQNIVKALLLPNIHWLDGRLFCAALGHAVRSQGGIIKENTKAIAIKQHGNKIQSLEIEQNSKSEVLSCEKIILCSGFGTNSIKELPQDIPKSRAIRGVAITYQMDKDTPLTNRLIKHPLGILCPRSDGRLIVGATHEEDEAEPIVKDEAIESLKFSAERTMPVLKFLPIVEVVAGIRASVGDGMLRLGHSREVSGLYYALSQGGAGFLRAAIFGQEFAQFVLGNDEKANHISPFCRR
jgi:glycine oxidase